MRHFEGKTTVTRALVKTTCDLCGAEAGKVDWGDSLYDIKETEIRITLSQKDGHGTPDGGSGTEYFVDLCPNCFKDKLIPWLESQGCPDKRKEWGW